MRMELNTGPPVLTTRLSRFLLRLVERTLADCEAHYIRFWKVVPNRKSLRVLKVKLNFLFESLILAQDERWRRALGMQVERLCEALSLAVGSR